MPSIKSDELNNEMVDAIREILGKCPLPQRHHDEEHKTDTKRFHSSFVDPWNNVERNGGRKSVVRYG